MADRGYLGCSYSRCIINASLTRPSRWTRTRRTAAKRLTANGPYKDPCYLCMCTGSLFQDKRRPGTRSPSAYGTRKHGPRLCSFTRSQRITVRQRPHKDSTREYQGYPSAALSGFYRERNQFVFYSSRVPVWYLPRNPWFTLIVLSQENRVVFILNDIPRSRITIELLKALIPIFIQP